MNFCSVPIDTIISSQCGVYRYMRVRKWGVGAPCIFIMMNPGGSGAEKSSDTMKNCEIIARSKGYDGVVSVNLFGCIATYWKNLQEKKDEHDDIVGEDNDNYLISALSEPDALIIAAWGDVCDRSRTDSFKGKVGFEERVEEVMSIIKANAEGKKIRCLKGARDDGLTDHPFWLSWLEDGKCEDEIRKDVLQNYELLPFPL